MRRLILSHLKKMKVDETHAGSQDTLRTSFRETAGVLLDKLIIVMDMISSVHSLQ